VIHGKRELLYFIGSGHRGRTYIFEDGGFYFESPVNWYGQQIWDMTPAYQDARHVPLNLPLRSSCVTCHVSVAQNPAPGTSNKYEEPLMPQQGIGCERCHGPGAGHASGNGSIVNPAKLSAVRRDSVCMQCHLEGNAAIPQPGRRLNDFRPGDDLQDYVHYFVLTGPGRELRAASQFEALAESVCKRRAGEAFGCINCHDAHYAPNEAEKASYYRTKCITCQAKPAGSQQKHFSGARDCVGCHMPRVNSVDVAHTQATDHRIPRYTNQNSPSVPPRAQPELRGFSADRWPGERSRPRVGVASTFG
jgi:hypothetical protein